MSAGVADVATLGLAVNSDPIKAANDRLEQLAATSAKTEGATSKFMTATDALVAALNKNSAATAANTARMAEQAAASARAATGLDKVERATDGAATAATKLEVATAKATVAVTAQAKGVDALAAAMSKHGSVAPKVADNTTKHTQAANENTKAVGLNAGALQNLGFQINDVATMAAMGASGFQILASQGGQLLQIAQTSGGGIKGLLSQAGDAATNLAARIGLAGGAIGALAVGFGVAALAVANYKSAQKDLEYTTFGVGRASGATVGDLQSSAQEAASKGKLSVSSARDVVSDLNSTGRVDPKLYATVATNIDDLAKIMKTDVPTATTAMVGALSGGIAGFDRLNQQLLLVDGNGRDAIKNLFDQGKAFEAQRAIVDAYSTWLKGKTEEPSALSVFLFGRKSIGAQLSDEMNSIGKAFDAGTPQDQLAAARKRQSGIEYQRDAGLGFDPKDLASATAEVQKLEASIAKSSQSAKDAKTSLTSLTVNPLVESLNPAQKRIEDIQKLAKQIEEYLNNGGDKLDKDGTARRTMEGLNQQAAQLTSELGKGGAALAAGLERAQFNLKTVGFSDYAKSRASLIENDRVAREGIEGSNLEPAQRAAQLKAQADILAAQLKVLDSQQVMAGQQQQSTGGGRYSHSVADAPESWRPMIQKSAAESGYDPDFIASILWKENRFRASGTSPTGAQGAAQFMPGTARDMGVDVNDVESSIMGVGKYLNAIKKMTGLTSEQDLAMGYNWGPGSVQKWDRGGRTGTVPQETVNYLDIFKPKVGSTEILKETDERRKALELETAKIKESTAAMGKDQDGLQARQYVLEQVAQAQQRGIPVTEQLIASYKAEAEARAKLNQEARMTSYSVQGQWDRDQLGRTRVDQMAFSTARQVTNSTDMTSDAARRVIEETRSNQGLLEAKNMASEALTSLSSDLRRGATAAEAFSNVLNRIGDKALNNVIDSLVSSAFSSGGGSGGGGLGGLFGGIGKFFGFANGGIMTPQGPMPLRAYSKGGIATNPQVAIHGEGDMNEAYVPLPDGKRIPVAMQKQANAAPGVFTGTISYAPSYSFPQVEGMTPGQVIAIVDRRNQDFARDLPNQMRNANLRRG